MTSSVSAGLIYYVIDITKDSAVGASGAMTVKGSNVPVQTASSEYEIDSDGNLVRPNPKP